MLAPSSTPEMIMGIDQSALPSGRAVNLQDMIMTLHFLSTSVEELQLQADTQTRRGTRGSLTPPPDMQQWEP